MKIATRKETQRLRKSLVSLLILATPALLPLQSQGRNTTGPDLKANLASAPNLFSIKQGSGKGASVKVNLSVSDSSLHFAIYEIAKQAGMKVVGYDTKPLTSLLANRRVSVKIVNADPKEAFNTVLKGTGLSARIAEGSETVVIGTRPSSVDTVKKASSVQIHGRVIDSATKQGVSGVTVSIAGHDISTVTSGYNGAFVLRDVPPGEHRITVRMFGYRSVTHSVNPALPDAIPLTIVVSPLATALTEVVTTATGDQERIKIGNDIAKIDVQEVLRNAPVTNMSELLTTRVPGVIVQKTSGAPGAPSVIRIRGQSSLTLNNDPIIIVDGVRVYSTVSEEHDGFSARRNSTGGAGYNPSSSAMPVTSALDQIDPNNVESVEVLRGPSAAALYGTDAANGIIVITTRRGTAGPTRWTFNTTQGTQSMPGAYPNNYHLWGRTNDGSVHRCYTDSNFHGYACIAYDSLVVFQLLNDDRTSFFGRGSSHSYSGNVSGGSQSVQYALTANKSDETGYQRMPVSEVQRLERLTGNRVPGWQQKPMGAGRESGNLRVSIRLSDQADMGLTSSLARATTRSTPLRGAISAYLRDPGKSDSAITATKIADYRRRENSSSINSTLAANLQWRPLTVLSLNGDLGWNRINKNDESLLMRGDCPVCMSSARLLDQGEYGTSRSNSDVISLNARGTLSLLDWKMFSGPTSLGLNYSNSARNEISATADGLPVGGTSLTGAEVITTRERITDTRVAGIYIDQRIGIFNKFYTGFGLRWDSGSGMGSRASAPMYPKLDFSIPVITPDEPYMALSMLRVRTAFGHSGVQPDITAKLRTFGSVVTALPGSVTGLEIVTMGNTELRPERSVEFEGGVDIGILDDRFTLGLTGYRKNTRDALIDVILPPSVGGGGAQQVNVGNIANTGMNAELNARVVETSDLQWIVFANVASNSNKLTSLSAAMKKDNAVGLKRGMRAVVGYPLSGVWGRQLVGYADLNGDGWISENEIRLSDSLVFVAGTYPKYDMSFGSSLGLFRGRVRINTKMTYQHGMGQNNQVMSQSSSNYRERNDTLVSLESQAHFLAGTAFMQTVSVLRLNEFSISTNVPSNIVRHLRFSNMSVALQGSNLGLWTNYSGVDPNVRSQLSEAPLDNGSLPSPRSWMIRVNLSR